MNLETVLSELVAAIKENTETMRSLATAAPANVVPITAATPAEKPAAKPKAAPKKEKVVEETPEPEVVEETPEPEVVEEETEAPAAEVVEEETEAPAAEVVEEEAEATDEHLSWDEPKLRLATQEYAKTKLVAPDSKAFKDAFTAELASLGVEKAAKLSAEQLPGFYSKMLTW